MIFLQPWWLLLAAAAAVPVVIHLLRRRVGRRVELPTARYLARAEAEHSRELRLRNVLLLVLRAAAIVFLAIALARPVVPFGSGAPQPGALALVVDNSMSSGAVVDGAPTIERLKRAGARALARTGPQDRVWLVTVDGRVIAGLGEDLRDALSRLTAFSGRGDIAHAISLARAAVEGSGLPGRIAVVSDGQSTQWNAELPRGSTPVTVFVPRDPPPSNRAVVEATADPLRWSGGSGALRVAFLSSDSALYRVSIAGRSQLRGVAEPDARLLVPLSVAGDGWIAGTVETERDELPADDVRHFAAFVGPVPRAAADPSAGEFARTAVATLVDAGRLGAGGDVTIAAADAALRLPALLTAPADPVRLGAANRALERLDVPWRFGAPVTGLVTVEADSALFGAAPPPNVTVRYLLQLVTEDANHQPDTLATAAGEPWIVAGARYVLIASPLEPGVTSLPLAVGFLPWLEGMLAHRLAGDARGVIHAAPGDTLAIPAWADAVDRGSDTAAAVRGRHVAFAEPGVYYLLAAGSRVGAFVVNAPRAESDLARLTPDALRSRFADGRRVSVTTDPDQFESALLAPHRGTDATAAALLLVVVFLLLEMLLRSDRWSRKTPG